MTELITKALPCPPVAQNSACGDDARGIYKEFVFKDRRVIVTSGVPVHEAEHDAPEPNPNKRCERWQYAVLPTHPTLSGVEVPTPTPMGTTGWAVSGAHIFDHRSRPDGSLAIYYELQTLDSCLGHSDPMLN